MAAIRQYWWLVAVALAFRLLLVFFAGELSLLSRPEVATPVTSLRRLVEGHWLEQQSMSRRWKL